MMSTEVSERKAPSSDEMIESIMSRKGGVCITLNGFFKMLLEALTYNVICVTGQIYISKVEDCHMTLIVSRVEKDGDLYNVDVGMGYPTFQAIPLHDDHLPRDYQFAFHHVRYSKNANVLVRSHKKTSRFGEMKDKADADFEGFIEYDLIPRQFSYFNKSMNVLFTDESKSLMVNITNASLYPSGKAITLRDLTLRIWSEDTGEISTTTFDSHKDAIPAIVSHFPMIDKDIVTKGFAYWLEVQRKKLAGKEAWF